MAQRHVQYGFPGVEHYDDNSNIPTLEPKPPQWNETFKSAGPNSFLSQSPKPTSCTPNAVNKQDASNQSDSSSPERDLTPSTEYSTPDGYSSEEESEENSDRSFSKELSRKLSNLKRKGPEKTTSNEEYTDNDDSQTSQSRNVRTIILSLPVTPRTPPMPPSPSALDRNSMEASSTTNDLVGLPNDQAPVVSSMQTNTSSSTSFESNTSSSDEKRYPR